MVSVAFRKVNVRPLVTRSHWSVTLTGPPVTVTDQCGRVTNGRTLTFRKATDTIEMDGNRRVRTQTKNGTKCQ